MQQLFDAAKERLSDFLDQRRNLSLMIRCTDPEIGYLLAMLQGIEQAESADLFWYFPFEFENPRQFVSAAIENHRARMDLIEKARLETEDEELKGLPPFPSIPPEVFDQSLSPVARLRLLMCHGRDLIFDPEGVHAVFAILPMSVHDPIEYGKFVLELLDHRMPNPWCHNMRLIIREDIADPALHRNGHAFPRVEWFAPGMDQAGIEGAIEEAIYDESLPLDQRMQTLLIFAALDYSYSRFEDSMEKYSLIYRYFQAQGNKLMEALALNGMGEVFWRTGNLEKSLEYFEQALYPAIEGKAYPAMMNVILNLGMVSRDARRYPDSIAYYEQASKLALELRNAELYILCLENKGLSQLEGGDRPHAGATWIEAADRARDMELDLSLVRILERQRDLYRDMGLLDRERETVKELAMVEDRLARANAGGAS